MCHLKHRLEASIVGSGHSYASMRIESRYTLEAYLSEVSGGISSMDTVKAALKMAEEDWPALLSRLEKIRSSIVTRDNLLINLTGDNVFSKQCILWAAACLLLLFVTLHSLGSSMKEGKEVMFKQSHKSNNSVDEAALLMRLQKVQCSLETRTNLPIDLMVRICFRCCACCDAGQIDAQPDGEGGVL